MTVSDMEIWLENRRGAETVGIDEAAPRLSTGAQCASIQWRFTRDDGTVETSEITGEIAFAAWPFSPLARREGGYLSGRPDGAGTWSPGQRVERGIAGDWNVGFVSPSTAEPAGHLRPAYWMRADLDLTTVGVALPDVARARVYASAHGVYELEMNGRPISEQRLAPGWTSYRHRLRTQTYDITESLLEGRNTIGAWLADGWYRGHYGFDGGLWDIYGSDVALLCQLEITTTDGDLSAIPLTWTWRRSPISAVGLYEGESYDATREERGWSTSGFDARGWTATHDLPLERFSASLEAPTGPPVRVTETILPAEITPQASGRIRLDFGQNISGVLRIRPRAPRGTTIRLHHAEVLEDGELGTRPLRGATSIDTYVCAGRDGEEYAPRFTIHGFRYAEIEGWVGPLAAGDVEALVIHTDMRRTGWFSCSDASLNRLHENVVWSMRDNFVDIPTDCPQRDERMGWTGDIQVFAPTAFRLFASQGTLTGWLRDLAAEQWPNGHVPQFVPWVECGFPNFPTAAWGDAAVVVPWEMYRNNGDTTILEEQYGSMAAWVDLVVDLTEGTGLWNSGFQLGDWLDPSAPPDSPGDSQTDRYLVATAYHVKTARILAQTARILGRDADAARYTRVARRAVEAFRAEYVSASGRVVSDTPTAIAVALVFDLLDGEDQRARAGHRLLELVEAEGHRISTGFVGTPIICDALVQAGGIDHAYRLLMQRSLPSWLYPVTMGATTIWERWDSMLPDGSINPGDMTSFNHYALGAVADFLHRVVAGLQQDGPGWRRIRFAPLPGGGLAHAGARFDTARGRAAIEWDRQGTRLSIRMEVPPGARGTLVLPETGEEIPIAPGVHVVETVCRAAAEDPISDVAAATPDPIDA